MRSLFSATIVATALFACGHPADNSSSVADANATAQSLTWQASYLGATDQGSVSLAPGAATQIAVHNMPSGSAGDMVIKVMSGSQVVYSGKIVGLSVVGGNQLRRVSLSQGSAAYSADLGGDSSAAPAADSSAPAQAAAASASSNYCGANFNNFDNNNNFDNFNNNNNFDNFNNFNNFNNSFFNNGFNNGSFNNGFNNGFSNGFGGFNGFGRFDTGSGQVGTGGSVGTGIGQTGTIGTGTGAGTIGTGTGTIGTGTSIQTGTTTTQGAVAPKSASVSDVAVLLVAPN